MTYVDKFTEWAEARGYQFVVYDLAIYPHTSRMDAFAELSGKKGRIETLLDQWDDVSYEYQCEVGEPNDAEYDEFFAFRTGRLLTHPTKRAEDADTVVCFFLEK